MTDVARLADLIAGQCRVRVGDHEGIITGFGTSTFIRLDEREIPWGEVVELEQPDEATVAAHWEAIAAADRRKLAELRAGRVREDLLAMDPDQLAAVVADPEVAARLRAVPPQGTTRRA